MSWDVVYELVRKIPRGIEYLFSPTSHKNANKASGYPQRLDRLERMGLALGPAAYLSSRWRARRLRQADDERRRVRGRGQAS